MHYVANITLARFNQKGLYLEAAAYQSLRDGTITIMIGPAGDHSVQGTLKSCNQGRQGYVTCRALYLESQPSQAQLPLQLGDLVKYETKDGKIRILSIQRSTDGTPTLGVAAAGRAAPKPSVVSTASLALPPTSVPGSLPSYLEQNEARIRCLGRQVLPLRPKAYRGRKKQVMLRLYDRFPTLDIQREDVVTLYREWDDPELALVAAMIWGGINATRPKKGGGLPDLDALLSHTSDDIKQRMTHTRDLVLAGKLREAFLACSRGGVAKLKGVGPAYFTKVFFFVGQAASGLSPLPLIFDKWTQNAFFLLLAQADGLASCDCFFDKPDHAPVTDTQPVKLRGRISTQADAYVSYVTRMATWADRLKVPAGQLEQFVFGASLQTNSEKTNPRNEILQLIRGMLASRSLHRLEN
jgi:hypothetical protein